MRSKLFVPGIRPELFAKALASDADGLSFDLEDSVPEEAKALAREHLAALLGSTELRVSRKCVVVRINPLGSTHFDQDMAQLARPGVHWINLPKVESGDDVLRAVDALERAEAANAVEAPIRLLVNIETPRGLRMSASIAAAHPRVIGLQLGLADLFAPFGIDRADAKNVHAVMLAMRLSAAEAGVLACDAAFIDVHDSEGFIAEAQMARSLGFVGKSCIHPRQIALANEAFRPTSVEVDAARRIVEAADLAASRGHAAYVVDGRMIDVPLLERARTMVAEADAASTRSGH